MAALAPFYNQVFTVPATGVPAVGYKLYTYLTGTTTLKTAYKDQAGSITHTNPIVLGSDGRAPGGAIWLATDEEYTFTLKDSFDVAVSGASWDDIGIPVDMLRSDLANATDVAKGAALVGMSWTLAYAQSTVGAAIRQASQGVSVLRWIDPSLWAGLQAGTYTTDVITSAVASAKAAAGIGGTIIIPDGTYYTDTGLNLTSFTGRVLCSGTIKAKAATTITSIVDFSSSSKFEWHGGALDFNQTASTADADSRSDHGFYMLDARDGKIHGVRFDNIRIGEVIYIDGTSSVSPGASAGSKRIQVWGCSCVAFAPPTTDIGAAVYIRSDFYTGTGGGLYIAATNGLKEADYTLDATVAYQRTTTDIQFWGNRWENFDGFRLFNVARVTCSNQQLLGFYTRGYSLSPSCEDVQVTGGIVSGNAAHINANYACKRCTFADLIAQGEQTSVGQRHCLRTGFGSEQIQFKNIVGFGNDTRHVFVEGAKDVLFEGINLRNWTGGTTTVAISIAGGGASNTSSWVTSGIRFVGSVFDANYAFKFDDNTGTATIAAAAVLCDSACIFNAASAFFNGATPYSNIRYSIEGTFTPIFIGNTTAGTNTYTAQVGHFKLKDGVLTYSYHLTMSVKDGTMAGDLEVGGLPFASAAATNRSMASAIGYFSGLTFPANYTQLGGWHQQNRSRLTLVRSGSAQTAARVQASELGATGEIVGGGSYMIA